MKTRVIVGSLLVLLMIAVLYFGGFILLSMLALFSIAAIYEMGLTFRKKSYNPILIPAYVFALAYPFVDFYFGLLSLIILYMATVMATMIWSLFAKRRTTNDIIPSLFILSYPTLFLICMHLVYFSFGRSVALVAAGMAYAAPECADRVSCVGRSASRTRSTRRSIGSQAQTMPTGATRMAAPFVSPALPSSTLSAKRTSCSTSGIRCAVVTE